MSRVVVPIHLGNLAAIPTGTDIGFKQLYLRTDWVKLYDGMSEQDLVLDRPLDNFTPMTGSITAADSVLTALEKLQYSVALLVNSIPEAPNDGSQYVRKDESWNKLTTYSSSNPTIADNVAAGFPLASDWYNTVTGEKFYQKGNGIWVSYISNTPGGDDSPVMFADYATTTDLLIPYDNGIGGIGATLTSPINGSLIVDGFTVQLGDSVLVKDQPVFIPIDETNISYQNGVYILTQVGNLSEPFILTRADFADETEEVYPSQVNVLKGLTNKDRFFLQKTEDPVIGVSDIIYEINYVPPVQVVLLPVIHVDTATTDPLPECIQETLYLTGTSNGNLGTINGVDMTIPLTSIANRKILVKNQVNASQNGDYEVVQIGSVSQPWKLRRITTSSGGFNKNNREWKVNNELSTLYGNRYYMNNVTYLFIVGTTDITFSELQTGGGSQDLQSVTDIGNTTSNNIQFESAAGVYMNNGSRLKEGTIDAGYGGSKGIAQICAVGYELKWEAGRLYVMGDGGTTIREVSHNFTTTPTNYNDVSEGFIVGSRWLLDDGTLYVCTDNTDDTAVWELQIAGTQNLQSVTDNGNTTDNNIIVENMAYTSTVMPGDIVTQELSSNKYSFLSADGIIGMSNGSQESKFKNTNVTNPNVILEFPNKTTGGYTIATTGDIPTKTSDLLNDGDNGTTHFISLQDLPSNLILYATNVASGISTYTKAVSSITDPDYNTTAVNIPTGALTSTTVPKYCGGIISSANIIIGNPGIFTMSTIGQIRRTSGSAEGIFFYEVYKRTSAGVENLIVRSADTVPISAAIYTEFQAAALFNNGVFTETDRIVIKFYGLRLAGGSDPSFDFQFGGTIPVRTTLPVPLTVVPGNGVPLNREEFTYTSSQNFTLSDTPSYVYAVFVQGQELDSDQYSYSGTTLTIINTLDASDSVNILYTPVISGFVDYYTKAQVDAFLTNTNLESIIGQASASNNGYLSSGDWTIFNDKQDALGFTPVTDARTISTTSPLTGGGDLSADRTLSIAQSNGSTDGYLSSTDWTTFNGKQNALVSGTNISTINGNNLLLGGDIVISGGGTTIIPYNAYLNTVSGNNATAVLGDSTKPYLTMAALIAALPATIDFAWTINITGATLAITMPVMPPRDLIFNADARYTYDFNFNTGTGYLVSTATRFFTYTFLNGNINLKSDAVANRSLGTAISTNSLLIIKGQINIIDWSNEGVSGSGVILLNSDLIINEVIKRTSGFAIFIGNPESLRIKKITFAAFPLTGVIRGSSTYMTNPVVIEYIFCSFTSDVELTANAALPGLTLELKLIQVTGRFNISYAPTRLIFNELTCTGGVTGLTTTASFTSGRILGTTPLTFTKVASQTLQNLECYITGGNNNWASTITIDNCRLTVTDFITRAAVSTTKIVAFRGNNIITQVSTATPLIIAVNSTTPYGVDIEGSLNITNGVTLTDQHGTINYVALAVPSFIGKASALQTLNFLT